MCEDRDLNGPASGEEGSRGHSVRARQTDKPHPGARGPGHTEDHAPFSKSQLASTQSTSGPCVVQVWPRAPRNIGGTDLVWARQADQPHPGARDADDGLDGHPLFEREIVRVVRAHQRAH